MAKASKFSRLALGIFSLLISTKAPAQGAWGKFIPPDYPWLRLNGRVDLRKKEARFDWALTGLRAEFEGSACAIYLDAADNNFNAFVDGELKAILGPKPGNPELQNFSLWISPQLNQVKVWVLDQLSPGLHVLELVKRTGANFGTAKLYGLRLDAAARLRKPAPPFKRRIEFIGDSLTNAYGCEGQGKECAELRPFENASAGFAALAAKELMAEPQVVALSGYGVVRNYGDKNPVSKEPLRRFYGRALSSEKKPAWERSMFKPDAIVINLGTNDFSTEPVPGGETFVEGYMRLLDEALKGREKTPVFLVSVKGEPRQERRIEEACQLARDRSIDATLVEFDKAGEHELGCDWHPKAGVHRRWALALSRSVKKHMHW